MNFEQFYAAWDPKWGTPEVDVADLIMQVLRDFLSSYYCLLV